MGVVVKKGDEISEKKCIKMEHVHGFEMINSNFDPHSSKNSFLEKKDVLPMETVSFNLFDCQTSSSSSDQTEVDEIHTPPRSIFDPFAPGPDDLMLAPKTKKLKNSYVHIQKRLDFEIDYEENVQVDTVQDSEENVDDVQVNDSVEEEQLFYSVFNSILEMIISIQLKEISVETMATESCIYEDCYTPINISLLPSIAETCPPAPMRRILTLKRRIDRKICRKLEYEVI